MLKLGKRLSEFLAPVSSKSSRKAKQNQHSSGLATVGIESLEERLVLYAISGNAWPDARVVTISFMPDGTNMGGVYSNLMSTFDATPGLSGQWQQEILRAAQSWAEVTNINFVLTSDSGASIGSGLYQQGSPTIGDIRIGGFAFGNSILAEAFSPPPINNQSIAGDIQFNTSIPYGIGTSIDLYTVAVHEIGHALGLNHSTLSTAQMFPAYNGIKNSLTSDDISGIRAIYSNGQARSKDGYEGASGNNTINNYSNINGDLQKSKKHAIVEGGDITTSTDVDFYRVTLPRWTDPQMVVRLQATGLSLLAPKLTIYAENKVTVLGTVSGASGSTVSLTVNGVGNNDIFYFKVESADSTDFDTGVYGLTLDLGADTVPLVTPPNTTLLNGSPVSFGGAQSITPDSHGLEVYNPDTPAAPTIAVAENSLTGTAAANATITIYASHAVVGTVVADAFGSWSFDLSDLGRGKYHFEATATDDSGLTSFESDSLTVKVRRKAAKSK